MQRSLLFLVVVVSLCTSCSSAIKNPLTLYFQRIEKLKVQNFVVSYNQEKTEKRVQILWARAREVDFPYGKNGVLHILEDRRITDEKQESFLIVLLTKNKKLDSLYGRSNKFCYSRFLVLYSLVLFI